MAKCKNCGKKVREGSEYCMKPECRKQYDRAFRKALDSEAYSGKCKGCGCELRAGNEYCMKPDCRAKYMKNYMKGKYGTDEDFRREVLNRSVKHTKFKRKMRKLIRLAKKNRFDFVIGFTRGKSKPFSVIMIPDKGKKVKHEGRTITIAIRRAEEELRG